jgi:cytoskeletal protein RodZ
LVDAEQGHPDQPENKPQPPPALGVNSDANKANARRKREDQQQRAESRLRDKRDKRMVWFTGVIAFATLVYAGISAWQLVTMHSQLVEQISESSANSTQVDRQLRKLNASVYEQGVLAKAGAKAAAEEKIAADAARKAADTATAAFQSQGVQFSQQLGTIKKSVVAENRFASASEKASVISTRALADHEAEQRANVTLFGFVNYDKGTLTVGVRAQNAGVTTARQVNISFLLKGYGTAGNRQELIRRQNDTFAQMMRTAPGGPSLPQSVAYLSPSASVAPQTTPQLPEATWATMKHIAGGWVLVARVTYGDIYGVSHWTNLCTHQAGNDTAIFCPSHNDQDNNTEPHGRTSVRPKSPGE